MNKEIKIMNSSMNIYRYCVINSINDDENIVPWTG